MTRRSAVTMLEVLVAIGILALLIGIILSAVQKVRETGLRTTSKNNLRQLVLGFHHYAAGHDNRLPGLDDWDGNQKTQDETDAALLKIIAREGYLDANVNFKALNPDKPETFYVPMFIDPGDPSCQANQRLNSYPGGNCSYPINTWAFRGASRRLPEGFADGTSQTIAIAGHYMRCGTQDVSEFAGEFCWHVSGGSRGSYRRRATFADPHYGDVLPQVERGMPTQPTRRNKTFQVAPALADCDPRIPQTPYRAGLLVAMMDGSVRTVKPDVDPFVFWAAVTPDGRESERLD